MLLPPPSKLVWNLYIDMDYGIYNSAYYPTKSHQVESEELARLPPLLLGEDGITSNNRIIL